MTRMTRRDFGLLTAGTFLAGAGGAYAQTPQVLKVGLIPSEDSWAMLKFPRFRGHPNICVPGVHHGQKAPTLHA